MARRRRRSRKASGRESGRAMLSGTTGLCRATIKTLCPLRLEEPGPRSWSRAAKRMMMREVGLKVPGVREPLAP